MMEPTLFGINGSSLMAGGEAGPEAILPLKGFYAKLEAMLDSKLNMSGMEKYLAVIAQNSEKGIYLDGSTLVGKLSIPQADPYGYSLNDNSTPDWLWNPFDFELGVIDDPIQITLTADSPTGSCTIPHSAVPFVVSIQVTDIGETGLKMTVDGDDYLLQKGENRLAELLVGDQDLTLNFSGRGSLQVLFRRRVI